MTYQIILRFSQKNNYKWSCFIIKDTKLPYVHNIEKILLSNEEIKLLDEFESNYLKFLEKLSKIKDSKDANLYAYMTQETFELLRNIKIDFDLISEKDFYKYISEPLKYINDKNLLKLVNHYYFLSQEWCYL